MKEDILLGAHMSISGGIDKAVKRGEGIGCTAIQVFTKSRNQWNAKELLREEVDSFKKNLDNSIIKRVCAHSSYLINLATPEKEVYEKSIASMLLEIDRCSILGIPCLVLHPGSTKGRDEKYGIKRISDALNRILSGKTGSNIEVCIETTSGQGSAIGYRFEHIREIIERTEYRTGVCFDTCHVFTAGYDMRNKKTYNKTMEEFDKIIGISKLKIIHLNDSKKELGSRVDRHEHIGKGYIGLQSFKLIMNDKRLKEIPKILETPKGKDMKEDKENMKILKKLCK